MNKLVLSAIEKAQNILISGHIRPDGDCCGSTLAVYTIICKEFPDKKVTIALEDIADSMRFLTNADKIEAPNNIKAEFDLFISLDCGDLERLGVLAEIFSNTAMTINIDHHISNTRFAKLNIVENVSSASELAFTTFGGDVVDKDIAEMLYVGILHDTGNLRHSCTTKQTLSVVGELIDKGINFSQIIDKTFLTRTFLQTKLLGISFQRAKLFLDNRVAYTYITIADLEEIGADKKDTGVIIDDLRIIKGVEVAVFLYELDKDSWKVSLRVNSNVNACLICEQYGGGGHIKAAGCTMTGSKEEILDIILMEVSKQL